jgi:RHS repeat-associated protein
MKTVMIHRFCISIAFLCLFALESSSQSIISREYVNPFANFSDIEIDIQDDRLADLTLNTNIDFRDKLSYGIVTVGFDPDMNICHAGPVKYKIFLKSEETLISTPGSVSTQIKFYDLTINYDPLLQTLETESAFIKVDFARKMILTVLEVRSIDVYGNETVLAAPNMLATDVYVEGEIFRERYDDFNPTVGPAAIPSITSISPMSKDYYLNEHKVHIVGWGNVDGAVDYEIEWTYVNDFATSNLSTQLSASQIHVVFKDNASSARVPRKSVNRFYIPAIYGRGYIVYRVRAIGRGGTALDEDIFGNWTLNNPTYNMSTIVSSYSTSYRVSPLVKGSTTPTSFNNDNSQYSIQFAEEGKMVASGTFADGSMRVRQNVSAIKIHDDQDYGKMASITETIYDHMGRAAITTLPAVTKNGLWYTPKYSINTDGEKYSYLDFDTDNFAEPGSCATGAAPMENTSGASLYYSALNPDKGLGHQGLIADAHKYPFIQSIFERDNTSRHKLQSGVGYDHKIGSGHETKYIYGGAEQSQLNRLFGTDAGYAGYYQKSMVQDPNGQISITYTDMAGRTVATSLAGEVPDNVQSLTDGNGNILAETGETVSDDMLVISTEHPNGSSNIPSSDGKAYTFSSTIMIDTRQEYKFSYSAQITDFVDACFPNICFECVYDLEISLTDECGNYKVGNLALDGPLKMRIGGHETDTLCSDSIRFEMDDILLTLDPGSYNIYKKLSINESSMNAYVEQMLQTSICLLDPSVFYQAPDLSGCEITCEQCLNNIGTWEEFFTQEKIDSSFGGDSLLAGEVLRQVYANMKASCEGLCTDNSRDYCDAAYNLMLMDMSFGGQYAEFVDVNTLSSYPLSIFNPSNLLPKKLSSQFQTSIPAGISGSTPSWRRPVLFTPNAVTPFVFGYYDEFGQRAKVHVELDGNNQYSPQVLDPTQVFVIDVATNQYYTYHENLLNLDDFYDRWRPIFAKSLVIYHPEFFQYEYCSSIYKYTETVMGQQVDGFDFDEVLTNMSFMQASSEFGLSSAANMTNLFDAITGIDPYFAQHPLSGCSGTSFSYTPFLPNLSPCNLFKLKFMSFQQLDVMRNIAQLAYIQNTCGYTYPTGCGTLPTQIWGAGGLIHDNQTWQTFAQLYASAKQQSAIQAMNMYAFFGDTPNSPASWNSVRTECIGNNAFFPVYDWHNGFPVLQNPCTFPYFMFYQQKERRFQNTQEQITQSFGLSNPPTLDELNQYALQGAYQQTGKCPMASDLEFLMNKLALDDRLIGPLVNLNTGGYMGNTLYTYLSQELSNPTLTASYQSSIVSNTLKADVGLGCEPFTLTLPAAAISAGYTFADIQTIFGIRDITTSGGDHLFKVSALFLNQSISSVPETLVVSGKSCLPLTGCEADFKNLCKPTQEAKDLMALMNALSMGGDLFGSSVSLATPYNIFITPRLQVYLGIAPYQWNYDGVNNEFKLSGTSSTIVMDISASSLNPANAYQFLSVTGNTSTSTTPTIFSDFKYKAVEVNQTNYNPFPTSDPNAVYANLEGSVNMIGFGQSFPITECEEIVPLDCNTAEHKNLRELEEDMILALTAHNIDFSNTSIDSCFTFISISDPSYNPNNVAHISVVADMSMSDNYINSNYFNILFKMNDGTTVTAKGKWCKALRNCDTCEEPCQPGDGSVTIGPLSQLLPRQGDYMSITNNRCRDIKPSSFSYQQSSLSAYWIAWADAINASTPNTQASIEGDYMVINFKSKSDCRCDTRGAYEIRDSESNVQGSYTYVCCSAKEDPCPTTIMELNSFPKGWFNEQTTFEQVFWGERTDNSLVYPEDNMLIFENKCQAVIKTNTMYWDMSALYRITCQFLPFETPNPVESIQLAFFDATGSWLESINVNANSSLQTFYYTPSQNTMQFGIDIQNIDWQNGGICDGSSKVGLKYLKIESLGPNYHASQQYVSNQGLDATNLGAPGTTINSLAVSAVNDNQLGVKSTVWISDGGVHVTSACAGGFTYPMQTCPRFNYQMQAQISAPDPAYAPTAIYAVILDNNGNFIQATGPYSPGTINYSFTPTVSAVRIVYIAVNTNSTMGDLLSLLGSGNNFNDFCDDSLHFVLTQSIAAEGCVPSYACGSGPAAPCKPITLYTTREFGKNWLEQDNWQFLSWEGTNHSSVTGVGAPDNYLLFQNDCRTLIQKDIMGATVGSLYHFRINTMAVGSNPYPNISLKLGNSSSIQAYGSYPLAPGQNDIYFVATNTQLLATIDAGNYYGTSGNFVCQGSSTVGITSMSLEKMDEFHIQEQYVTSSMNSTVLSTPGITLQQIGIHSLELPNQGITQTEIKIENGHVSVSAACASGITYSLPTCPGFTYEAEMEITAPDVDHAPSHIMLLTMNPSLGYIEAHGPYSPGLISFSFTPTVDYISVHVIAVNSNSATLPSIESILQTDGGFANYCTDSVVYHLNSSTILSGCKPKYVCGPYIDPIYWEPVVPLTFATDCTPTILPFPSDTTQGNPCQEFLLETAQANADYQYQQYLEQKREEYKQLYIRSCMQPVRETFDRVYSDGQYHYTLYYYDRAGNLVKTVPPHAVTKLEGADLAAVNNARDAKTIKVPKHNQVGQPSFALTTRYRYNSLNQAIEQITPDGGKSNFYYDRLGRTVLSQNAVQQPVSKFSYTLYDALGRVKEVGEFTQNMMAATRGNIYVETTQTTFFGLAVNHAEVTRTFYDVADMVTSFAGGFSQNNLRSRVSYTTTRPKGENNFVFGTYYNYDIHGNVKSLVHQNLYAPSPGLEQNLVEYEYDLLSGVVKKVGYNKHKPDHYFHKYAYDDQNRLTHAYTSRNGIRYDLDARYFYYWHGPLARTELGNNKVQGIDQAYTIHGWVKSLNNDALQSEIDPGKDGHNDIANNNRYFAKDAYGLTLSYYTGDYTPIETSYIQAATIPLGYAVPNLWNGNIGAMSNTLKQPGSSNVHPLLQTFKYDQLNRITESKAFNKLLTDNTWSNGAAPLDIYATSYSYDPAGNLLTLTRNGEKTDTLVMDSLQYVYYPNTNRLMRVEDVIDAISYGIDVDDQSAFTHNYAYDAIGNLIKDEAEEIANIEWTVLGKVSKVTRNIGSNKPDLQFYYDADGKRIMKKIIPKTSDPEKTEFYANDAQGNPLTIYSYLASETPTYKVNEQIIYGSRRLGVWKSEIDLLAHVIAEPEVMVTDRGRKRYELNDHLGNVHIVFSDRKKRVCEEGTFSYYEPDIRNTYDYYAFGMMMPGRNMTPNIPPCTPDTLYAINETFDSGTGGFLPGQPQVVLSNSSGKLRIAVTHLGLGSGLPYRTYKTFNAVSGKTYQLSFSYDMPCYIVSLGTRGNPNDTSFADLIVTIRDQSGNVVATDTINTTLQGSHGMQFTAPSSGNYTIEFRENNFVSCTYYLDNLLLSYVEPCPGDGDGTYASSYRFGYNGQEKDNELKGEGNSLNYTFRMYDTRIARFFAVDPISSQYPELTPYQAASNSPIINIELEGLEGGNSNSPSIIGNTYFGIGLSLTLGGKDQVFSKVQLTGGARQDFNRIGGMTFNGAAGTFGITSRAEFKGTFDLHPTFAFRGYLKVNASLSTPLGTFSGELKAGPDKYSASATNSAKGPTDSYMKSLKNPTPGIPSNPIKTPGEIGTVDGLGKALNPPPEKAPIPLQFGYKPITLSDDFVIPGLALPPAATTSSSTSPIKFGTNTSIIPPKLNFNFKPIIFNFNSGGSGSGSSTPPAEGGDAGSGTDD